MKQLVLLICLLCSVRAFTQDQSFCMDTMQTKSVILNEDRSVVIIKSKLVSPGDSVRFLYLIDGEYAIYRVQQMMDHFGDSLSNWIVVGIANTDRRRNLLYANGAAQFLEFITQELVPVVEKDHKIQRRILYGHSFGGSFTVYAMLNKPVYFNGFIASSPTPIMDLVQKESYLKMDSTSKDQVSFYFSCGSRDMKQVFKWSQKLSENLSGLSFKKLKWQFQVLEGKDHNNSDVSSLVNGLKYLK